MKKQIMLWFIIAGTLAAASPALAAKVFRIDHPAADGKLYAVEVARKQSPDAMKAIPSERIPCGSLWIAENRSKSPVYCGLFFLQSDAESLRQQLHNALPQARVVAFENAITPHWLPCTRTIRLADIGYTRPIVAQGFSAYAAFSLHWNEAFSLQGGRLHLQVSCSPVLNNRSSVKVVVEGIPMTTVLINRQGPDLILDIPLNRLQGVAIGESLDVELHGYLSITDDRCVDELSGNLWMIIDNASYFRLPVRAAPVAVRDYLMSGPETPFNIVLQALDKPLVGALCRLSTILGSLSRTTGARFEVSDHSVAGPNIFIGNFPSDLRLLGRNLYVTPRGVDLLASRWFPALLFSEVSRVDVVQPPPSTPREITFEDLGLGNKVMQGIGDLGFQLPFTLFELGGWPADLSGTVVYATTPVPQGETALLKIKLNGILIAARKISAEKGIRTATFRLPTRYLQASNTLEITISYYLNRGDCQGSLPEMEVSIFKDSSFTTNGLRTKPPLSLASYPALLNGKGLLVLDDLTPRQIRMAAQLLAILGRETRRPLVFDVADLQTYTTQGYRYAIFLVQPENLETLHPLVETTPAFQIVHPLTQKVLLRCTAEDQVSTLQAYYSDTDVPCLVLAEGLQSGLSHRMLRRFMENTRNANVAFSKKGAALVFEIGDKFRVVYPFRRDMRYYWNQYRLAAFILSAALALVFLFYLYRKLAKR